MPRKVYYVIYLLFAFNFIVSANTFKTDSEFLLPSTKGVDFVRAINIESFRYNFKNPISEAKLYKYPRKQIGNISIFYPNFVWYGAINFDFKNWILTKGNTKINDGSIVQASSTIFDTDTDGDGILDEFDIDDDNDGITDDVESPNCFYNIYEASGEVSIRSQFNGAGTYPAAGSDIPLLYDDNLTANAFSFATGQTVSANAPIFTIEYPTSISLRSISVDQLANGIAAASRFGKLYGSNDNLTYTEISPSVQLNATLLTFTTNSNDAYKYYQIRYIGTVAAGNSTASALGTANIREISSILSSTVPYIPALHPKPGSCNDDTDGDGTPDHLDLDSDGDGCFDAYEGGARIDNSVSVIPGPYGTNGLANSLETVVDNGVVNYKIIYNKYANNAEQNLCKDFDGDGIIDVYDIDSDNDGIPDVNEGYECNTLSRNIRIGYLNVGAGSSGVSTNLLQSQANFGKNGRYNKIGGVTLVPFATVAEVTEANLLNREVDVFLAGSSANDNLNATGEVTTNKVPTSVNLILANWAKNNNKGVVALQNNVIDYGYLATNNNSNPDRPYGALGADVYTNGYWPIPQLDQFGSVQMTISSRTRIFDILMLDSNVRPAVVADREYNLILLPDADITITTVGDLTNSTVNRERGAGDTWAFIFDKFLESQCFSLDTDGDGIPNHLDLDSDGDGCFDAYESGSTTDLSVSVIPGPYGTNGLANSLETVVDNGIINYNSTYNRYATTGSIILCQDIDSDGVADLLDIDNDNDGILNATESPNCYFTANEANRIVSVKSSFNGAAGTPAIGADIPLLHDGNTTTNAYSFLAGQAVYSNEPIFTIEYPTSLTLSSLVVSQLANGIAGASTFGKLYGSHDNQAYDEISPSVLLNATTLTFTTNSTASYKYYQIRYIGTVAAGNSAAATLGTANIREISSTISSTVAYVPSLHPKPGPCNDDADGDGTPNYLDSDSDGDGCFDSFEGSATSDKSLSVIPGPYGTNGLANSLETTADSGIINYSSTYKDFALSATEIFCTDTDGDGIVDVIDIDDDNDGVLDSVESPGCFYTVNEANKITSVNSSFNGAAGDPQAGSNIPLLIDGNLNNGAVAAAYNFAAGQTLIPGSAIFNINYPTSSVLSSMTVTQTASGMAASGFGRLYGSNDGENYTVISNAVSLSTASVVFNNTTTNSFRYYQIRYIGTVAAGNTTNVVLGVQPIHEITSQISTTVPYIASAHPKPGPCNNDTDGDGIPNHLDLDSDDDGCFDSFEGSATSDKSLSVIPGPYGANGLANSLETTVDSGLTNYTSTYKSFGTSATEIFCTDTDGDGIVDAIDIDDDNDGALDAEESPRCFYNLYEATRVLDLHSTFNGDTGDPQAGSLIPSLFDDNLNNGVVAAAFNFAAGQTLTPGAVIFTVEYPTAFVSRSMTVTQAASGMAASGFGRLFGSNDGENYTAISNGVALNTASVVFNNTTTTSYKYYQIRYIGTVAAGNAVNVALGVLAIHEIASQMSTTVPYIVSEHQKPGTCTEDTDGDGIPNNLDLDSDGDGCFDSYESGATTDVNLSVIPGPYGVNGFADALETTANSGLINYKSLYYTYAIYSNLKYCEDSDSDGIADPIDLDDDNDGILDTYEQGNCSQSSRIIKVGYLNVSPANLGVMINLLTNPDNFGQNGIYNKVSGVTVVPFANAAAITEASLLANEIDIFYVGSGAADDPTNASKAPTAVNLTVAAWAKAHNKAVFAIQNNSIDYEYKVTNNNANPNVPYGTLGRNAYTDGYWPTPQMIQTGSVQMTIMSQTRIFNILMTDANLKPVVITDRDYNLIIFPDATIYNTHAAMSTAVDNDQKTIASTWAFIIDQFINKSPIICPVIDTDGDGTPDYLDLDSDNDGCADAVEGSANLPTSNLVPAGAGLTGGTGSDVKENLCSDGSCVNEFGIPLIIPAGQNIGTSTNASLGCFCYKPAEIASGVVLDASVGISALGRRSSNTSEWPIVRKGAWLALESKNKGFVLNRIPTTALVNAIPTPIEGMMVYDEEADCIKIYTTTDNVNFSWKCYDTQTCPD